MSSRYRVYCDGELFSDSYIPDPNWHLQEPQLKIGDNSAGSFEFVLTSENVGYSMIERMASTIVVGDGEDILWSGRVISQSEDFFKRKKYVCEGAMAYLNDTHVGIKKSSKSLNELIPDVISEHNTKLTKNKDNPNSLVELSKPSGYRQIECRSVNISDALASDDTIEHEFNNETTFDWINTNVIEAYGCHSKIVYDITISEYLHSSDVNPKPRLVIYDDYIASSNQTIDFGVNLLDFTKNWDLSNLVTVIIPRGKQLTPPDEEEINTDIDAPEVDEIPDDGLTHYLSVKHAITKTQTVTVNGQSRKQYTYYGSEYVYNENAYNKYGRIEKTVDFSDIEDPTYLLKLAKIYVKSLQFNSMVIEIKAIDMHHVNSSIQKFKLLSRIRCVSKPHGMDTEFPLIEMTLDLENPANNSYVLGESKATSLTGVSRANDKKLAAKFAGYPTPSNMLDVARYEASILLNDYNIEGYVNIVQESKTSQALVISDNVDWRQARELWKWDMNGLGFSPGTVGQAGYSSSNGYYAQTLAGSARWYKTAITKDGQIVADFVSTGILSDGAGTNGQNWWNLSNGECSFSAGTIKDSVKLGEYTVSTLINMADTGFEYSKNNQVGGVNLLDGTESYDGWRFNPNGKWSRKNGIAASDKPALANYQTYAFSRAYANKKGSVPAYFPMRYSNMSGSKYTFSCEIASFEEWGAKSNTNKVAIQFTLEDSTGKQVVKSKEFSYAPKKTWTKIVIKFTMSNSGGLSLTPHVGYTGTLTPTTNVSTSSGTKKKYTGSWNNLYFSVRIYNVSKKKIQFRHVQLEKGTQATDWKISKYDSERDSQKKADTALSQAKQKIKEQSDKITADYKSAVRQAQNGFSAEQKEVIKGYTKREAILATLTGKKSGSEKQGLYISNKRLYINGEFIQTGYIKASLIKVGVLSNLKKIPVGDDIWKYKKFFFFNLSNGVMKARTVYLKDLEAYGTLDCGTSLKTVIADGAVNFYRNAKTKVSRITAFQSLWGHAYDYPMQKPGTMHGSMGIGTSAKSLTNGLFLATHGPLVLRASKIYVGTTGGLTGDGTYYRGVTGETNVSFVKNVTINGETESFEYGSIDIGIQNGLVYRFNVS